MVGWRRMSGPIVTAEEAYRAIEWMVESAVQYATARADKERAEHMLRVVKSLAMKDCGENAVSAQEREAYASEAYLTQIQTIWDATVEFEKLRALREAAEKKAEFWRSYNKTLNDAERNM